MSAYPTDPQFATANVRAITQSLVSRSQSGRTFVRRVPGHQWAFSATYSFLTREQMAVIFAFAMEQDGTYGAFTVAPPDMATPRGTALGSLLVNGAAQAGTSLAIKGADPSQPALLKPMDIFTVAGDPKVYMVTQLAASDVTGLATLNFRPALEKTPVDAAAITTQDVSFTMSFANPTQEYNVSGPIIYDFKVDLVEAN